MSTAPPGAGAVAIHLAGVDATLASADADFLAYARAHLAPLCRPTGASPTVRASLTWHEGAPPPRAERPQAHAGWERLDRDLYRRAATLAWYRIDELPDLHLRLTWHGDGLEVAGTYYHRLSKTPGRDRLQRLLRRRALPRLRRRRYTTLLYYLLYYPCFWWLERHHGFHPIHAGAAALPEGIVALAGPSGVGKSTTLTGLATHPGARLLSDTFLLHRDAEVRAVPEPLLIDAWGRATLGADAARLQPLAHAYSLERGGYHWPADALSPGGPLRLLLLPRRAAPPGVRRLAAAAAQGRIRATDLLVNDLRRYWAFAAALEMLDPSPLVQAREHSLAALVAAVPTYELALTPDLDRDAILALVHTLLHETSGEQTRKQ